MPHDPAIGSTQSYGYSTNSIFSPSAGWTSTGSASGTTSGSMSTGFSASSPFSESYNGGTGTSATMAGTASGSGSDWDSYNYTQTDGLASDGTWSPTSGSGGASGGSTFTWGYSGSGSYSQYQSGSTLTGGTSESGSETYTMGYSASGSVSPTTGQWVQSSGAGNASASGNYSYGFSGDASGSGGGWMGYGTDPLSVTFAGGAIDVGEQAAVEPTAGSTTPPDSAVWGTVSQVEETVGGVDTYGDYEYAPQLPFGTGPGVVSSTISSVHAEAAPSPGSLLDQTGPVPSLVSLSSAASLEDSTWGMGNVAFAGYGNNSPYSTEYVVAGLVNPPAETPMASGNNPAALPTFKSDTIRGAGAALGRNNIAPVVPVTDSSMEVNYGSNGITASPPPPAKSGVSFGEAMAADDEAPATTPAPSNSAANPLTNVVVPRQNRPGNPASSGALSPSLPRTIPPGAVILEVLPPSLPDLARDEQLVKMDLAMRSPDFPLLLAASPSGSKILGMLARGQAYGDGRYPGRSVVRGRPIDGLSQADALASPSRLAIMNQHFEEAEAALVQQLSNINARYVQLQGMLKDPRSQASKEMRVLERQLWELQQQYNEASTLLLAAVALQEEADQEERNYNSSRRVNGNLAAFGLGAAAGGVVVVGVAGLTVLAPEVMVPLLILGAVQGTQAELEYRSSHGESTTQMTLGTVGGVLGLNGFVAPLLGSDIAGVPVNSWENPFGSGMGFSIGAGQLIGWGYIGTSIYGSIRAHVVPADTVAEFRYFRAQGWDQARAQYLSQLYPRSDMGHHFPITRDMADRLGLPQWLRDSIFNVLRPSGISRGRFYELHYKVDPHYWGSSFPRFVGGSWSGRSLGLQKFQGLTRIWYATPGPTKAVGIIIFVGGIHGGYYLIVPPNYKGE